MKYALFMLIFLLLLSFCACTAQPSKNDTSETFEPSTGEESSHETMGTTLTDQTDTTFETEDVTVADKPYTNKAPYSTEKLLDYKYTENSGDNVQGTAIYENYMVQLCHGGRARIYDLDSPNASIPLATFELGSFTGSNKDAASNHANQCMFGSKKWAESDPLPLLYVTTGNGGGDAPDGNGYYARCAVERITLDTSGKWSSKLVQVISFRDTEYRPDDSQNGLTLCDDGIKRFVYRSVGSFANQNAYQVVSWGWPAFFVDSSPTDATKEKLYIHSARYRTTAAAEKTNLTKYGIPEYDKSNAYIVTGFSLPALPESLPQSDQYALENPIVLTPKDIVSQFETEFDIYFTQGGTMHAGKLYYSFGNGKQQEKTLNAIRIYDIAKEKLICGLDLNSSPFAKDEPECCCIYRGRLALSTQKKQIYIFDITE